MGAFASAAAGLVLALACQPPSTGAAPRRAPSVPQAVASCESKRTSLLYVASSATAGESHVPDVPELPQRATHVGDGAFTVWGVRRHFRDQRPGSADADADVTVIGYVVKTNFRDAPACALQKVGTRLPPGCQPPVPTLWLGDRVDQVGGLLPVKGFASSFAELLEAMRAPPARKATRPATDELWGTPVLRPVPAGGAKMRVTGKMDRLFTRSSAELRLEPGGVLTYASGEYVEPPPVPATIGR